MNNIHEMDWADERWHGHTGMDSSSEYCFPGDEAKDATSDRSGTEAEQKDAGEQE